MARGWESKGVESQIESAENRLGPKPVKLSPEELERERKRDSLLLQRTRVLRELENCDARRAKSLREGLAYLESQLTGLGWTTPTQS